MSRYRPAALLDTFFEGGILLKGASGVLELSSAALLLFINPASIHGLIAFANHRELKKGQHDILANILIYATQHIDVGSKWFAVTYLAIHGVIKLIAVGGILLNRLWAYPFSLITLGILTLYQTYNIWIHPTVGMVALTIFDIFVLWLIWREYQKVRYKTL